MEQAGGKVFPEELSEIRVVPLVAQITHRRSFSEAHDNNSFPLLPTDGSHDGPRCHREESAMRS